MTRKDSDSPVTAGDGRRYVDRYRTTLTTLYFIAALFFLALGAYEFRRITDNIDLLALERGRALFGLIELTREWNARHGGVYLPVTETTKPNSYLDHPRRDLKTLDGLELTMANPAVMTRQLAELAEVGSGMRFHLTSLKPLRPGNAADDWETQSLQLFESGVMNERVSFIPDYSYNGKPHPVYRFMAPLKVTEPCLPCHQQQGYKVGDIRGGISVTMPADQLLMVRDQRMKGSMLIVLASFAITSALLHLLLRGGRRHSLRLQEILRSQEVVIAERTRALEERNDELRHEVDERRRREHELQLAGAVFENAAEAIVITDSNNAILRVNPAYTKITGYAADEVIGRNPGLLKSGRHDKAFYDAFWRAIQTEGRWEGEIWNRRKDGDIFVEWLSITKIVDPDPAQSQYLAVFQDITLRKEAEEALRHKAHHDALTDLPNRFLFYDRLQATFNQARRYKRAFALMMIDLDHFKEVNDTLGHAAGDELLVESARRLSSCVRESDTVARLGGDEFAIILTDMASPGEAEQIARRAVELLAEPYHLDAGTVSISGCVGIALYPQHGRDGDELQRNADAALYAVKEQGRNGYRLYAPVASDVPPQGNLL